MGRWPLRLRGLKRFKGEDRGHSVTADCPTVVVLYVSRRFLSPAVAWWALIILTAVPRSVGATTGSLAHLAPFPRRHRLRISPQPFPPLSCFLLQHFLHRIPRRIFPVPPAPALFDQRVIDVRSIK